MFLVLRDHPNSMMSPLKPISICSAELRPGVVVGCRRYGAERVLLNGSGAAELCEKRVGVVQIEVLLGPRRIFGVRNLIEKPLSSTCHWAAGGGRPNTA